MSTLHAIPELAPNVDDDARKAFDTLAARAALAGQACTKTATGHIVLSRWGHAATFDTSAEAGAWLDRVTGARQNTDDDTAAPSRDSARAPGGAA